MMTSPWRLAAFWLVLTTALVATMTIPCQRAGAQAPVTTFYSFNGLDHNPYDPETGVIQGMDGNFYGTDSGGGSEYEGSIFKLTPDGTVTTLYSFGTDGEGEYSPSGLVEDSDDDLLGSVENGGAGGYGLVFAYTSDGGYYILHNFGSTANDGEYPVGTLTIDGDLVYGATTDGGTNGDGTLFYIDDQENFLIAYNFGTATNDGIYPNGGLVTDSSNNLYGTTQKGGAYGDGTIFKLTPSGVLTTLYSFGAVANDGENPHAGLTIDSSGNLYGTTYNGGGSHGGGVVFAYSATGTYSILHMFGTSSKDGFQPLAPLTLGSDGYLYGTTSEPNAQTVFQVTPSASFSTIYNFGSDPGMDSAGAPLTFGALIQASDGRFYGTSIYRGANNEGSVFSFAPPAPTITSFTPTSGPVGTDVTITGTFFNGTESVTFNGIPSTNFRVASATTIKAIVPSGATTGPVQVNIVDGFIVGPSLFTVIVPPAISSFSPTSGPVGTAVTITGTNLAGATSVKFNGTAVTKIDQLSSTSVRVLVPAGATSGKITLTTANGTATSTASYAVGALPTITSFTPTAGQAGTTVSITGTNFTGATGVTFNGTAAASYTVVSATSVTAVVPSGATSGKIGVTTPVGTATSAGSFTVAAAPTITSFSPTSGAVGTAVTITGTNLTGTSSVTFNGTPVTKINVISSTSVRVLVPTGATSGPISLTTPGGTASIPTIFTVT